MTRPFGVMRSQLIAAVHLSIDSTLELATNLRKMFTVH